MAQMSVPAEPSYKTTSYSGLKGADFSNDPSLVARNHSPDLLNMISDNGGSPIKRKGWEVTDDTVGAWNGIWHFQMFGKKWHIGIARHPNIAIRTYLCEFNDDGEITQKLDINWQSGRPHGFFFNSADESKTGFYIICPGEFLLVRPATADSTSLTLTSVDPTVPVIRDLGKYDGTGGVTSPVNMLTRKMTFRFYDNRTDATRIYRIFQTADSLKIDTIDSVKMLQSDGSWETLSSSYYTRLTTKRVQITKALNVTSTTENVIEITITAQGETGLDKITGCTCSAVYSQMTEGQAFISGNSDYPQYVWYSELADPCYFPDTNYLFVGGAGTQVKGMMPFGSQLAVFKAPSTTESTIFLISYTTATDQKTDENGEQYTESRDVYQVKHGFAGIGSYSQDAVFALGDEPLFLSQNGIMGLVANTVTSVNSVKNRSGFVDSRLLEESNLAFAKATVHKNYYILVLNGHAYILDGRQKSQDYKGNTSYFYESYYWDNIPARAIASDGDTLWFGTADGRLCRFKNTGLMSDYSDNTRPDDELTYAYPIGDELSETWLYADKDGTEVIEPDTSSRYLLMEASDTYGQYTVFSWNGTTYVEEYTISPVHAVWSTLADNDGATQYFKTLQKKGSGCTLYPFTRSSVDAYLEKDGNAEVYIGSTTIDIDNWEDIDFNRFTFIANKAPRDLFFRKKMKKYKRLKIILKNNQLDEGFGVQEIFKTYLFTRYAK